VPDRKDLTNVTHSKVIITAMKNEAPYILEWVAHHLVIGFDHIVVLTNDCTDSTDRILSRLDALGYITFRPNRPGQGGVHRTALRRAARLDVVQNADWLYVTDADEFLNIHCGDNTVDALIAASGGNAVDVIMIPWRIFSNNRRPVLRDMAVTQQFIDAELSYDDGGAGRRFVKSIFRNRNVYKRIGLHNPHARDDQASALRWTLPGGVQATHLHGGNHVQPPFGQEFAQINHYAVRSAQAYLLKRDRGRANHTGEVIDIGYWERWNRGGCTDTTIHRYAAATQALVQVLKADPELARLHRKGFRWHKARVAELLQDEAYADLYRKISTSEPVRVVKKDRRIRASREATQSPAPDQPQTSD
jgi:hypothetical protein